MDRKLTIFDYLSQVFMIFGITILILNVFCITFGEYAKDFSTIFSLGSAGLSVKTTLQFLLVISITIMLKFLFTTDLLIKKLSLTVRIISLFASVFLNTVLFIIICKWFPVNYPLAWFMFLISFTISCTVSTLISMLKEKTQNRKLAEALKRFKEEESE
ncbi:MAG: hypothetical protein K2G63_01620 [Oscillospiraceae bacterium]|nr:hypothetical protein [Oscillospiraceae bacterium]